MKILQHKTLLLLTFFSTTTLRADPLLVAILMVKNEAPVMEMTLQPLVNAGIQDFLIYDTGSTDQTIEVTQNFFIKNDITNFVIEQSEFIDFATSRNKALELTEQHFPDATFMLMLDAEWILHNGTELLKFCEKNKNNSAILFYIQMRDSDDIIFYHARLMRTKSNIEFVGKVHEVPNCAPDEMIPGSIYFELCTTHYGQEKSQNRRQRDRDFLLQELQENPDNERAMYYLAQTYFALDDLENAIKWYEKRATMPGWDEENFFTRFILAQVYQAAGDHEAMIVNYLKAFCLRPSRAEPLIKLAEYYYEIKAYHLCYLFARHACTIPYPQNDCSLVEKWLYDFARYALLSATAYVVDDFALGKLATQKALKTDPAKQYLLNNLNFYEQELQKKGTA